MSEALPPAMVARLTQLATDLCAWSREHRDAPLEEQERAVRGLTLATLPDLLAAVLPLCVGALTEPVASLRQPCPACGKRQRALDRRLRQVTTICGPVRFERPYYYCRKCKCGWAPADASLGLEPYDRLSGELRSWLAELGAETVFRQAQGVLRRMTGLELSAETVRRQTAGVGLALESAQQAASAQVLRTGETPCALDPAPGLLVVEADGVMVRYRDGWHEVKLGVVGGYVEGKTGAQSYVAVRRSAEEFGPRLLAEAVRRGALEVVGWGGPVTGHGLAELRPVAVLGDGAAWIWNLAGDHFGESTEIVDFYHAGEHVWTVANTLYGQGSASAKEWALKRMKELKKEGIGPVLEALGKAKAETAETAEVVRRERGYFTTNRRRMEYAQFRERGLPIGSGAVESGAKSVVQVRMKRAGMRWSEAGAQGVLSLRAHLMSGRTVSGVRPQPVPVECPHPPKSANTDADTAA